MIKFLETIVLVLSVLADVCSVGSAVFWLIRRVAYKTKNKE